MGVITVSRQYGAGGRRVAEAVADGLGYRLVDREIVEQAAVRVGIDPDVAENLDERTPSLIEEMGLALAAAHPEMGVAAARLDDRVLAEGIARVVRSLADAGGYVILGRGGQAILRDHAGATHVQVVGLPEDRARRISEWQSVEMKKASELCKQKDAERHAFVKRFYGVDLHASVLYDVVCNTSRMSFDTATAIVLTAARARDGSR